MLDLKEYTIIQDLKTFPKHTSLCLKNFCRIIQRVKLEEYRVFGVELGPCFKFNLVS
jgi:hypothetical protein